MNGMDRQLRDLLEAAAGEPPHRVSAEAVRRRVIRRRALEGLAGAAAVAVIAAAVPLGVGAARPAPAGRTARPAAGRAARPSMSWSPAPALVTPISRPPTGPGTRSRSAAGRSISRGQIAITPDGKTAYVINSAGTVIPISTATNTPGKPITGRGRGSAPIHRDHAGREDRLRRQLGSGHGHPDQHRHQQGRQADPRRRRPGLDRDHPGREDRLRRQSGQLGHGDPDQHGHQPAGKPIQRRRAPRIAITPDGKTAYVANPACTDTVTPINTATNTAGQADPGRRGSGCASRSRRTARPPTSPTPTRARSPRSAPPPTPPGRRSRSGRQPEAIAITPDGKTAYVANYEARHGDPDHDRHQHDRHDDRRRRGARGIAITPDGKTAYVANFNSNSLTPIATATNTPERPIHVGQGDLRS